MINSGNKKKKISKSQRLFAVCISMSIVLGSFASFALADEEEQLQDQEPVQIEEPADVPSDEEPIADLTDSQFLSEDAEVSEEPADGDDEPIAESVQPEETVSEEAVQQIESNNVRVVEGTATVRTYNATAGSTSQEYTVNTPADINFTPSVTARYKIESHLSSTSPHSNDPDVQVYDGSNIIAADDDSGEGYNFKLLVNLQAGKTYRIHAFNYDGGSITFTVDVVEVAQIPESTVSDIGLTYGYTSGSLSVNVTAPTSGHTFAYQWYSNNTKSNSGGSVISGATSSTYVIPTGKDAGELYYYCVVTATKTSSGLAESNASNVATVTIDPVDITITADDAEKYYGEEDPELTFTIDGLIGQDNIDDYLSISRVEGEDVGTYDISVTVEGLDGIIPNYNVTNNVSGTFKINPGEYTIVDGADPLWTKDSSDPVILRIKRDPNDTKTSEYYTGTQIDDNDVPEEYIKTEKGSVIVKISTDYLKTLSDGEHTLTINFKDDAKVTTTLTIKAAATPSPQTGEYASPLITVLSGLFLAAGSVFVVKSRKA